MKQEGRTTFDDLFKERIESAQFNLEPEQWQKMQAALDNQDTKRRRGAWWWAAASVALLIIIGLGANYQLKHLHKNPVVAATNYSGIGLTAGKTNADLSRARNAGKMGSKPADRLSGTTTSIAEMHGVGKPLEQPSVGSNALQHDPALTSNLNAAEVQQSEAIASKAIGPQVINPTDPKTVQNASLSAVNALWLPLKPKWYFSAFAGLNAQVDAQICPYLGLLVERKINAQWSVGTGIGYSNRAENDNDSKTFTSVVMPSNGSGTYTHFVTISTARLHYLVAPVFATYHFGKQSLFAGATFNRLFNSDNTIKSYDLNNGEVQHLQVTKASGYYDGYYEYSTDLTLGYSAPIARRLSIELKINYGLTLLKKPNYFDNDHDDDDNGKGVHDLSAQLTLKYQLLSR